MPAAAVEHGLRLAAAGADLLDVGGESTRPGSEPVDAGEELRRVLPVIEALRRQTAVPISIDTSRAAVARAPLAAGAEAINDVTALAGRSGDAGPGGRERLRRRGHAHAGHAARRCSRTPRYADVVGEVFDYLRRRRDALLAAGIDRQRIALDPGIGFGKTTEHNLAMLAQSGRFHALGCPLLVGPSRKRFIGEVLGDVDGGPHGGHDRRRLGRGPAGRAGPPRPRRGRRAAGAAAVPGVRRTLNAGSRSNRLRYNFLWRAFGRPSAVNRR